MFGVEHENGLRTYEIDVGLVCSQHDTWVEGIFDSVEACKRAVEISPDALHEAWMKKYTYGVLTVEDLA